MLFTALFPAPPIPITLIRAPIGSFAKSRGFSVLNDFPAPPFVSLAFAELVSTSLLIPVFSSTGSCSSAKKNFDGTGFTP
jgi:hypothetical protein